MQDKICFFTFNDFMKDGGGTIRMRSIVNTLAEQGVMVTLISNTTSTVAFHPNIQHVYLDYVVNKRQKRLFQFMLSFFPSYLVGLIYRNMIRVVSKTFYKHNTDRKEMYFFEYLDNSVGYLFKQVGIIENYVNDLHGIVPLEFKFKESFNIFNRFINFIKFISAKTLDKKVFINSSGLIFVSNAMQNYFYELYPTLINHHNYIVRDGVNSSLCQQIVDATMVKKYKEHYGIQDTNKVVLFAGNFKDLGGVIDLVEAFSILITNNKIKDLKLLLLGDGERYEDAKKIVAKYMLENKVIFVGRTKYSELRNYQELADVIVCPDKQHPFSELVPHIKYFDSLASGKVVINGSFASVKEINPNEKFSVNFEPSNVTDLANKIERVLEDIENFTVKYKNNKQTICSEFTYTQFAKVLLR